MTHILDKLQGELRSNGRDQFRQYIIKLWNDDTADLSENKWEDITFFQPPTLLGASSIGLTDRAIKSFPLPDLLKEKGPEHASRILKSLFLSTAFSLEETRKEAVAKLTRVKLATIKSLQSQSTKAKPSKTIKCGTIGEAYQKLANRSEDVDISAFAEHLSKESKVQIGVELIRNGLTFKRDFKGKWLELSTDLGESVNIYFAGEDDENASDYLTHSRCAIITALDTAAFLAEKKDMPALGLNLGWQGLTEEAVLKDLNTLLTISNLPKVGLEDIYLVSIPKVKPHKILNISISTAYLFLGFHILNDAYNSTKRKDGKLEASFTADAFSKIANIGHVLEPITSKTIMEFLIKPCIRSMKHKGMVSKEYISVIKSIMKTIEFWKNKVEKNDIKLEDHTATDDEVKAVVLAQSK